MAKLVNNAKAVLFPGLIVATFYIYFVERLSDLFIWLVLNLGHFINSGYINNLYAEAARMESQSSGFTLTTGVFVLLIALFLGAGILRLLPENRILAAIGANKKTGEKPALKTECLICKLISGLLSLAIAGYIAAHLATSYVEMQLVSGFQQHLRILAPYLTAQQEKELVSKWSLMSGQGDYVRLYQSMNKFAAQNQAVLPLRRAYLVKGAIVTF